MHLVTFRKGRSQGRVGAIWHEAVIDLAGGARDPAAQRKEPARGRGFPKTMLELVEGGETALARAREAFEAGQRLVDAQGSDDLAARRLAYPPAQVGRVPPVP